MIIMKKRSNTEIIKQLETELERVNRDKEDIVKEIDLIDGALSRNCKERPITTFSVKELINQVPDTQDQVLRSRKIFLKKMLKKSPCIDYELGRVFLDYIESREEEILDIDNSNKMAIEEAEKAIETARENLKKAIEHKDKCILKSDEYRSKMQVEFKKYIGEELSMYFIRYSMPFAISKIKEECKHEKLLDK